eukprot:TRINITY_DN3645_c0_g10_i1.p2 TRINITY_DN3645_c0_g10~~TRINITY_DN3645_c0_g10_i1.p2  ORF type:complete len:274 (-),score=-12.23 TRINITY_DN3645_c0_g10_i1:143-964(-)
MSHQTLTCSHVLRIAQLTSTPKQRTSNLCVTYNYKQPFQNQLSNFDETLIKFLKYNYLRTEELITFSNLVNQTPAAICMHYILHNKYTQLRKIDSIPPKLLLLFSSFQKWSINFNNQNRFKEPNGKLPNSKNGLLILFIKIGLRSLQGSYPIKKMVYQIQQLIQVQGTYEEATLSQKQLINFNNQIKIKESYGEATIFSIICQSQQLNRLKEPTGKLPNIIIIIYIQKHTHYKCSKKSQIAQIPIAYYMGKRSYILLLLILYYQSNKEQISQM